MIIWTPAGAVYYGQRKFIVSALRKVIAQERHQDIGFLLQRRERRVWQQFVNVIAQIGNGVVVNQVARDLAGCRA